MAGWLQRGQHGQAIARRLQQPVGSRMWRGPGAREPGFLQEQQQQPGDDLGDKCSLLYPLDNRCSTPSCVSFRNITLSRISVMLPSKMGWPWTGSIQGNVTNPMENVVFRRVTASPLVQKTSWPWPDHRQSYLNCQAADGRQSFSEPNLDCLDGSYARPVLSEEL
mgnify:CR=1 FL=1